MKTATTPDNYVADARMIAWLWATVVERGYPIDCRQVDRIYWYQRECGGSRQFARDSVISAGVRALRKKAANERGRR